MLPCTQALHSISTISLFLIKEKTCHRVHITCISNKLCYLLFGKRISSCKKPVKCATFSSCWAWEAGLLWLHYFHDHVVMLLLVITLFLVLLFCFFGLSCCMLLKLLYSWFVAYVLLLYAVTVVSHFLTNCNVF